MPRVLRILNRLAVGGPVLNATYLTKFLAPEYETLLVVGEKEDHEQSAEYLLTKLDIRVTVVPGMGRSISPLSDYSAYRSLRKLIREFRPDIVHTHSAKPGTLGRLAAAAEHVPVIIHTFHGHVFHSYFNSTKTKLFIAIERYLAKKSDVIIAISAQQKKELSQDFRIAPESKFRIVPLGFDLDRFRDNQPEKRNKFRTEFNLDDDTIAIGIIGRLVPIKNHYLFLKAIKWVLDKSDRKIRAFIIGDGDTRNDLEQTAKASNIGFTTEKTDGPHDQPLVFTSWRSDVDVINAGIDISCLTSLNEGTPVSLIEAQAANKPVVSTKVGGIGDIVIERETGLLSEIEDTEGFCNNLLSVVNDDLLRSRLGNNSSEHILNKFSYQRLVRDVDHVYKEMLNKKTSKNYAVLPKEKQPG